MIVAPRTRSEPKMILDHAQRPTLICALFELIIHMNRTISRSLSIDKLATYLPRLFDKHSTHPNVLDLSTQTRFLQTVNMPPKQTKAMPMPGLTMKLRPVKPKPTPTLPVAKAAAHGKSVMRAPAKGGVESSDETMNTTDHAENLRAVAALEDAIRNKDCSDFANAARPTDGPGPFLQPHATNRFSSRVVNNPARYGSQRACTAQPIIPNAPQAAFDSEPYRAATNAPSAMEEDDGRDRDHNFDSHGFGMESDSLYSRRLRREAVYYPECPTSMSTTRYLDDPELEYRHGAQKPVHMQESNEKSLTSVDPHQRLLNRMIPIISTTRNDPVDVDMMDLARVQISRDGGAADDAHVDEWEGAEVGIGVGEFDGVGVGEDEYDGEYDYDVEGEDGGVRMGGNQSDGESEVISDGDDDVQVVRVVEGMALPQEIQDNEIEVGEIEEDERYAPSEDQASNTENERPDEKPSQKSKVVKTKRTGQERGAAVRAMVAATREQPPATASYCHDEGQDCVCYQRTQH